VSIFTTQRAVRLLEHDADLVEDVPPAERGHAIAESGVRVDAAPVGSWVPAKQKRQPGAFGLFILEGLMVRSVSIGDRTCAEVLGPGDVLRPWVRSLSGAGSIESSVEWTAVEPTALAVLGGAFVQRMAAWPAVISALGDRVTLRTHWLAFHLAVCHMRRVDERVLIVLWHFADRWGRVTPDGVVLSLPLTHALLAKVIGGQRPSVSSAIGQLQRQGLVSRSEDRSWVLHGEPPDTLAEVRDRPTGSGRITPDELRD
jgi:CRP/FNR family cyclic AMP-dependent transcriptional regulator